jgi:hypothetical protein
MPAVLGRGNALIQDISTEGARVMHFMGHAVDSDARPAFSYDGRRFSATAGVLAGRVIGLHNGPSGETSYQSRLQFVDCTKRRRSGHPLPSLRDDGRRRPRPHSRHHCHGS